MIVRFYRWLKVLLFAMGRSIVTTGTIIMIVCAVLLILLGMFFKKDLANKDHQYPVTDDPAKGLDGISGVVGMSTKDLDIDYGED